MLSKKLNSVKKEKLTYVPVVLIIMNWLIPSKLKKLV